MLNRYHLYTIYHIISLFTTAKFSIILRKKDLSCNFIDDQFYIMNQKISTTGTYIDKRNLYALIACAFLFTFLICNKKDCNCGNLIVDPKLQTMAKNGDSLVISFLHKKGSIFFCANKRRELLKILKARQENTK